VWQGLFFAALLGFIAVYLVARSRERRLREQLSRLERENEAARSQEEKARLETIQREETLLNSISEGILFLDDQSRVIGFNEALGSMLDWAAPMKGKTLLEAVREHTLMDLISELRKTGMEQQSEITVSGTNGNDRVLQVSGSTLRRPGGDGYILTFYDITRLKQLEQMRKEFVANVSHELRTPLTLIKGFAETLLDGAIHDPDSAHRFVSTIHRNADRLALIIEDLLAISALESGQVVLEKQTLRLHPLVNQVISELQGRPNARPTTIENAIAPEIVACADLQRLQQVLTNLVDNAIKYGREEGEVRIGATVLPDKSVQISVADNGPGIPPDALDRIFERFYRVDKARSREQGGTGLGLSIVKHIVQVHGGKLWVDSKLGEGSTFYFTLPQGDEFEGN
jgi:two-component system phosphate regulon sensor histidine kinase PhoR